MVGIEVVRSVRLVVFGVSVLLVSESVGMIAGSAHNSLGELPIVVMLRSDGTGAGTAHSSEASTSSMLRSDGTIAGAAHSSEASAT